MYDVSLTLRMTEEVYQKIKKIAEEEKRSINGQINFILEKYAKEKETKN